MCCAKIQMISAVVLLSMCIISSQGAQFYTTPKIHPGKLPLPYIHIEHISEFVIAYRSHVIVIDIHSNISRYLERANNSPSDQVSVVHHPKKRAGDNDGAVLGFGQKHTK